MEPYGRIYKIVNAQNDKVYIGLTTRPLSKRFNEHKTDKRKTRITGISRAMRKYGYEHFSIVEISTAENKKELMQMEKDYILEYNSLAPNGYNFTTGGEDYGFLPETITKISRKQKGRKFSDEHLKNLRAAIKTRKHNPMFGRQRSREEKRLILKRKGQYHPFNVYDKAGKYLDTWEFISECKEKYNMTDSAITLALQGKNKHVKGYFFKKVTEVSGSNGNFNDIEVIDYKLEKKIAMLKSRGVYNEFNVYNNLTGELIGTWVIKSKCAKEMNLNRDSIKRCLDRKQDSHKGYTFSYVTNNTGI